MPFKKKSIVGGRIAPVTADPGANAGVTSTQPPLPRVAVSMRKVIAKKIAVEKLLTAKRPL